MKITDKNEAIKLVQQNGYNLEDVNDELRNDREVVLAAVKQNVSALEYASPKLKADREFILEVVETEKAKIYFKLLEYVSPELKLFCLDEFIKLKQFLKLIKEKNLK